MEAIVISHEVKRIPKGRVILYDMVLQYCRDGVFIPTIYSHTILDDGRQTHVAMDASKWGRRKRRDYEDRKYGGMYYTFLRGVLNEYNERMGIDAPTT